MTDKTRRCSATAALLAMIGLVATLLAGVTSASATEATTAGTVSAAASTSAGSACRVVTNNATNAKKSRTKAKNALKKQRKALKRVNKKIREAKKKDKPKKRIKKLQKAKKKTVKRIKKQRSRVRTSTKKLKVANAGKKRLCRTSTIRVSVSSKGVQGNGPAEVASIAANDRHVVFLSRATNLVAGDTNGTTDVFVHDLVSRTTKRVNVSSKGAQANGNSGRDIPSISANGRYVVFSSDSSNLVAGDTNNAADVFVRDLRTKKTKRVSVASGGAQAKGGHSDEPVISANGRYVTFVSEASNLTSRDTDESRQVYVHDLRTRQTRLVSHASNGTPANGRSVEPAISADGRYIAYSTEATNLGAVGATWHPDVYVWDRAAGRSYIVSVDDAGRLMSGWSVLPSVSNNGQIVAYERNVDLLTNNGVAVTNRALKSGDSKRSVSYGSRDAYRPKVSGNGRYVAVGDGKNVQIHDRVTGSATTVNVSNTGARSNRDAELPSLTTDGRSVAFVSSATNLVGGDTNGVADIFVRRR